MGKIAEKFNALKSERIAKSQIFTIEGEVQEQAIAPDPDGIVPESDYPKAKLAVMIDGVPIRLKNQSEPLKSTYKVQVFKANATLKDNGGRVLVHQGQERQFAL